MRVASSVFMSLFSGFFLCPIGSVDGYIQDVQRYSDVREAMALVTALPVSNEVGWTTSNWHRWSSLFFIVYTDWDHGLDFCCVRSNVLMSFLSLSIVGPVDIYAIAALGRTGKETGSGNACILCILIV
jgi:hypothetical protein